MMDVINILQKLSPTPAQFERYMFNVIKKIVSRRNRPEFREIIKVLTRRIADVGKEIIKFLHILNCPSQDCFLDPSLPHPI